MPAPPSSPELSIPDNWTAQEAATLTENFFMAAAVGVLYRDVSGFPDPHRTELQVRGEPAVRSDYSIGRSQAHS